MIKSDVVKAMEMEREMLALERLVKRHLNNGRYNLASGSIERLKRIKNEYQCLTGTSWPSVRRKFYKTN